IGVAYAPAAQPTGGSSDLAIGNSSQVSSALSRIFLQPTEDSVIHVVASPTVPAELQHGWVRAVAEKLKPKRMLLVDTLDNDLATAAGIGSSYRSPAVLASAVVVGLAAAVLNYADAYGIPCRHMRVSGQLPLQLLTREQIDAQFSSSDPHASHSVLQASSASDMLRHDVSASLYL
ncbi:hypothetical protein IWW38_004370, partial [Coemansia aciculifera]